MLLHATLCLLKWSSIKKNELNWCSDVFVDRCEEEINECASAPCINNGTCTDLLAEFSCDCPEEYEGVMCEKLKRVTCENIPCHNYARCADIFSKYK
jgi:hypothetical protein